MRNAFLALVLINLGFAAWHQWFARRPEPTRSLVETEMSIALASETNAGAAEEAADPAVLSGPQTCVSIGPYPNRVVVNEVTEALRDAAYDAVLRVAQGDVWLGYWVYIDAIPTSAEAAGIVERLTANGIGEAYVIADGDRGSLVSLGVFSIQGRAQQRLAEARELGYEPIVVDRSQPGDVYWLDVTAEDGTAFTAAALLRLVDQEPTQVANCETR